MPPENDKLKFDLHLPGLLKVLAEHLYSNQQVGLRELLQNAHDSCTRRMYEAGEDEYRPRIDVTTDAAAKRLIIADNGSGLTRDEIGSYLSTIGRGYTRELRESLAFSEDEERVLIGQFGLGFLSAFLLGAEVRVVTRSYQPGSEAIRWRSIGDEYYEVEPAERDEVGTTVELELKPASRFLLGETQLTDAVQKFADFLPTPIHVNHDAYPTNAMGPPWNEPNPEEAIIAYVERTAEHGPPLLIIPLAERKIELDFDQITVPLAGFLYIPPGSVASVREYGDLSVFIRGMFICERERHILPSWAKFVRGVIDCPMLQPTASREDVHQDDSFGLVQQAIEDQVSESLERIARESPETWRLIVLAHSDLILGWAVMDDRFFESIADLVELRTSRGPLSLRQYRELAGDTLHFVTQEIGALQEQILGEGRDVPVIDASRFAIEPFLEKYAERESGVRLIRLDGEAHGLLRPVRDPRFEDMLNYFREQQIQARLVSFNPQDVPALITYPKDAELIRDARTALDQNELPSGFDSLIGDYVDSIAPDDESLLHGTLHINAACPLLQTIVDSELNQQSFESACSLIYEIARLFAGRMLSARDAIGCFRKVSGSLQELIG